MFTFEKAGLPDIPVIRDIASRTWGDTYGEILSPGQLDYMFEMMYSLPNIRRQMELSGHTYYLVREDGVPSGYLSVERKKDDLFNFQKIYSLPETHGKGIGRFIIEQGIDELRRTHPTPFTVELYVNRRNPAVGFYRHMGFSIADTRDHDIGQGYLMNDYIMRMEVRD